MNNLVAKLSTIDLRKWTVISLLVLWTSTTFSIALMEIAFVTAFIFWGMFHLKEKRLRPKKMDWLFWGPLGLFFLFVLLSFILSEYPKESFRGVLKTAKPLLVFIMTAELFCEEKTKKQFSLIFAGTFLLVALDSAIQYIFGKDFLRSFPAQPSSAGLRLVGPFGDFGRMGCYLILVIPVFGMHFLYQFKNSFLKKKTLFSFIFAIVGFVLLYLTRTRGAVLALVMSIFLLFIYRRWFKAIGVGILLFLALLLVTPKAMIIHLDAQAKEQSLVERIELWKRAWYVIETKPWTGTGINTYNVAHEKYDKTQNWRVRGYYAHNGYLQLAAEIGIPGIFCLLLFLFLYFRKALRHIKNLGPDPESYMQLGILTGLLAFLIYALADTGLQSPQSLMSFWYMMGVLLARQLPQYNNGSFNNHGS